MIIFRCDHAFAIVADLLADADPWWDGELETTTGFTRTDYERLQQNLVRGPFEPEATDLVMMRAAANDLLGYPGISTIHVEQTMGDNWREHVGIFLQGKV